MKITLSKQEKETLLANKTITVEKSLHIPAPKGSIIHGKGNGYLWDKIDRKWVYGDIQDYIQTMMHVGRRGTEYTNNGRNYTNGALWYDCNRTIDDFGLVGQEFTSGRKDVLKFKIDSFIVSELKEIPNHEYDCKRVVLKYMLVATDN